MLSSVSSVCFSIGVQCLYSVLVSFAVIHGGASSLVTDSEGFVLNCSSLFYGGSSEVLKHETLPKGVSVLKAGVGERNAYSPLRYLYVLISSTLCHLFSRLNKPRSLSLSLRERCSSPHDQVIREHTKLDQGY